MKLNPDFQAGATKKTPISKTSTDQLTQAIDNNFRAKAKEDPVSVQTTEIPAVKAVTEASAPKVTEPVFQKAPAAEQVSQPVQSRSVSEVPAAESKTAASEEKKAVKPEKAKKENLILYLENGTRQELKVFCAKQDVSMNHFAICALEYLREEIANGNVTISKHGYKRK